MHCYFMIVKCRITAMSRGHYTTDQTHDITQRYAVYIVPRESKSKCKVSGPEHARQQRTGYGAIVVALEAAAVTTAAAVTMVLPTSDRCLYHTPNLPVTHGG